MRTGGLVIDRLRMEEVWERVGLVTYNELRARVNVYRVPSLATMKELLFKECGIETTWTDR